MEELVQCSYDDIYVYVSTSNAFRRYIVQKYGSSMYIDTHPYCSTSGRGASVSSVSSLASSRGPALRPQVLPSPCTGLFQLLPSAGTWRRPVLPCVTQVHLSPQRFSLCSGLLRWKGRLITLLPFPVPSLLQHQLRRHRPVQFLFLLSVRRSPGRIGRICCLNQAENVDIGRVRGHLVV